MNMDKSMAKAIPDSTATYKGHMNRHKSGLRSTKNQQQAILDAQKELQNIHPTNHLAATQEKAMAMFCEPLVLKKSEICDYDKNLVIKSTHRFNHFRDLLTWYIFQSIF